MSFTLILSLKDFSVVVAWVKIDVVVSVVAVNTADAHAVMPYPRRSCILRHRCRFVVVVVVVVVDVVVVAAAATEVMQQSFLSSRKKAFTEKFRKTDDSCKKNLRPVRIFFAGTTFPVFGRPE